jgi:hypothetical protein
VVEDFNYIPLTNGRIVLQSKGVCLLGRRGDTFVGPQSKFDPGRNEIMVGIADRGTSVCVAVPDRREPVSSNIDEVKFFCCAIVALPYIILSLFSHKPRICD